MFPLYLLITTAFLPFTFTASQPHAGVIHFPIVQRTHSDRVANLPKVIEALRKKYGYQATVNSKRGNNVAIPLSDELNDNTYSAVMSIGTPPQTFNIILDTGSSDFWVAAVSCAACTSDIPLFDPSKSSTYQAAVGHDLNITYGLGEVNGTVSSDTVTFGGFTLSNQTLLTVTGGTISLMLSNGLSGLMGLAFAPLSAQRATPFWQTLYNTNQLSEPLFSFYLERYIDKVLANDAPGGTFTLGGTNSSLYQGSIEYMNVTGMPSFWLLNVSSISVQGSTISVPTARSLAVIDTGTTLIAAPRSLIGNIWSKVPGSRPLDGKYYGLYAFPCNTSVSVSISFGGTNWEINPVDMNVGTVTSDMCAGAIIDSGALNGGFGETWIVGDTFLKNVYSVFRAEPPSVGFAQLASGLSSTNGTFDPNPVQSGSLPAPTTSGTSGLTGSASANKSIAISFVLFAITAVCSTSLV